LHSAWLETVLRLHAPEILLYCHAVCDVPKCEAAPEWRAKSTSSISNARLPPCRNLSGLYLGGPGPLVKPRGEIFALEL